MWCSEQKEEQKEQHKDNWKVQADRKANENEAQRVAQMLSSKHSTAADQKQQQVQCYVVALLRFYGGRWPTPSNTLMVQLAQVSALYAPITRPVVRLLCSSLPTLPFTTALICRFMLRSKLAAWLSIVNDRPEAQG